MNQKNISGESLLRNFSDARETVSKVCDRLPNYLNRLQKIENAIRSGKLVPDSSIEKAIEAGELYFKSLETACRKVGDAEAALADHKFVDNSFGFPFLAVIIVAGVLGASVSAAYVAKKISDNAERTLDLIEQGKLSGASFFPHLILTGVAAGFFAAVLLNYRRRKTKRG